MTNFKLDLEVIKSNNLSLVQFVTLINIYNNEIDLGGIDYNLVLLSLQDKSFIKIIKEDFKDIYILREKGRLFIESFIITDNKPNVQVFKSTIPKLQHHLDRFNDFDNFVKEYRNLFKGLKVGSQGSLPACRDKLKRWMIDNPNYTREDVLKAARIYINTLDNYQYLQQADYFIYKKDKYGEQSRLSVFVDEEETKESGWSSELC